MRKSTYAVFILCIFIAFYGFFIFFDDSSVPLTSVTPLIVREVEHEPRFKEMSSSRSIKQELEFNIPIESLHYAPPVCDVDPSSSSNIRLLLGIFSTPRFAQQREIIRNTWFMMDSVCLPDEFGCNGTSPRFVIRLPPTVSNSIMLNLKKEQATYNDLILLQCSHPLDCSYTLRFFQYAYTHYSSYNFTHIGKADQGTFVFADVLIGELFQLPRRKFVYGKLNDILDCEPELADFGITSSQRSWCLREHPFLSPELYVLTVDLALWIGDPSNDFPHNNLLPFGSLADDVAVSKWLWLGYKHDIIMPFNTLFWPHRADQTDEFSFHVNMKAYVHTPMPSLSNAPVIDCSAPIRIAIGVFSIADFAQEREIIRQTWWKFGSVCRDKDNKFIDDCQGIFPFFVVGKSNLSNLHSFKMWRDLLHENATYHDVLVTDIEENMNEGKSFSWFDYVRTHLHMFNFTHIGKTDMDCFVFSDILTTQLRQLPRSQLYFGKMNTLWVCDNNISYPWCPRDHVYMSGQFYLVTNDVMDWMTSPDNDFVRNRTIGVEDLLVGNWFFRGRSVHDSTLLVIKRLDWSHILHPVKLMHYYFPKLMNGTDKCCVNGTCCTDITDRKMFGMRKGSEKEQIIHDDGGYQDWLAAWKHHMAEYCSPDTPLELRHCRFPPFKHGQPVIIPTDIPKPPEPEEELEEEEEEELEAEENSGSVDYSLSLESSFEFWSEQSTQNARSRSAHIREMMLPKSSGFSSMKSKSNHRPSVSITPVNKHLDGGESSKSSKRSYRRLRPSGKKRPISHSHVLVSSTSMRQLTAYEQLQLRIAREKLIAKQKRYEEARLRAIELAKAQIKLTAPSPSSSAPRAPAVPKVANFGDEDEDE